MSKKWQFWIDRGGTFTDVVAIDPEGQTHIRKILSHNGALYEDAAIFGMREILELSENEPYPSHRVEAIRMGTTVATNALLERKGAKTLFAVTAGFEDILSIRDQRRPDLFAKNIEKNPPLYQSVVGIKERLNAAGGVIEPLDEDKAEQLLSNEFESGFRSIAIAFLHAYKNPIHELKLAEIAKKIGFLHITTSERTSSSLRIIPRAETAVANAYLNPILQQYVEKVQKAVGNTRLYFMQSNGGLIHADEFIARDAILSGPAGGIVGAVETAKTAGFEKLLGFDMGGTSTDVSHYAGQLERTDNTTIAGTSLSVPMMDIHTVAAGGGSICWFENGLYKVGPSSAGAEPGPACYGKGGPLTITDCNLLVGKLQPDLMPRSFGVDGAQALDKQAARKAALEVADSIIAHTNKTISIEEMAHGFITIANEHMVRAIKKISIERGLDIRDHCLVSFGGAGGQHATDLAETLEVNHVYLHPLAGVLSAVGIGLSRTRVIRKKAVELALADYDEKTLSTGFERLCDDACAPIIERDGIAKADLTFSYRISMRYEGTDVPISLIYKNREQLSSDFETQHQQLFGFCEPDRSLIIDSIEVEAAGPKNSARLRQSQNASTAEKLQICPYFDGKKWREIPFYDADCIHSDKEIAGPAVIYNKTGTNFVGANWRASLSADGSLTMEKRKVPESVAIDHSAPSPILLEIFKNRFMSIAEQMGATLERTAHSVNIKERLDFSCAVFDHNAQLVANAPHMPVHLGSMSESVKAVAEKYQDILRAGDAIMLNDPYNGGTHLPDITVVMPVFVANEKQPEFFIASRGHHADIGGTTPGSMPPFSNTIDEEGILIDRVQLIKEGVFQTDVVRTLFAQGKYPARNIEQNIADLKAQVSACQKGISALTHMNAEFGLKTVQNYMQRIQDNATLAIQNVVKNLQDGEINYPLDNGNVIRLRCRLDKQSQILTIDFNGTSPRDTSNYNAPKAITTAAVLYVFRLLADADIPLNAGCLKPIKIIVPENSLLNPTYPAAVVSGNVETSQAITNALLMATDTMASSQGTMNNFTFGDQNYQYYETIAGGSGAGEGFNGASAVQTHMTNSKMTDPEILELRYPVLLETFAIRRGSGGKGKWTGGDGVVRRIKFLQPMECSIISSSRVIPPQGLKGGSDGKAGINRLIKKTGEIKILAPADTCHVNAGDRIEIETPGGGGYGAV